MPKIYDMKQLPTRLGLGKSTIYELIRRGDFPPPLKLPGVSRSLWSEDQIDGFIRSITPQPSKAGAQQEAK